MAEINPLNRGNVNSNPSQKSSVSAKQTKESLFTKLDKDKNGMISTQ